MNERATRFADARLIAALALVAAGVRTWVWQHTAALFNDGPLFIGIARLMQAGEWDAAVAHPYHPLYPLAIRIAHAAIPSWETAAATVSVLSGVAAVVACFVFLRDAFERRTAVIGATILAVHPYAVPFSADVQSDGLYLAFFWVAVSALWKALRGRRAGWAGAAGAAAGLAYLVRPEGVGVLAIAGLFVGVAVLRGHWRPAGAAAWGGALLASALLVMAPYLLALRAHNGEWLLTQKKSVTALGALDASEVHGPGRVDETIDAALLEAHPFLETVVRGPRVGRVAGAGEPAAEPEAAMRALTALGELYLAVISTLRPELALLLLLGALSLRHRPGFRGAFVLTFAAFYLAVLYALAFSAGYVSRRHVLPPVSLLLGYVAIGVPIVGDWMARAGGRLLGRGAGSRAGNAAWLGTALVVAIAAPKSFQARRDDRLATRQAAEWLRDQPDRRGAVAASKLRDAYYADAPFVRLGDGGSGSLVEYLRSAGARYMIVDDDHPDAQLATTDALRDSMRVVHRTEARGRSAAVYTIEQAH